MALSLQQIITFLNKHADPSDHVVFVDGVEQGECTHASFRPVFSLSGLELVLDYSYKLDDATTTLTSRVRTKGLGKGGKERILENGQDVDNDDVLVGQDESAGPGSLYVEFRYSKGGTAKSVKFSAPLSAFHD